MNESAKKQQGNEQGKDATQKQAESFSLVPQVKCRINLINSFVLIAEIPINFSLVVVLVVIISFEKYVNLYRIY